MKQITYLFFLLLTIFSFGQDLVITGVFDGPLTGGTPKAIEIYVINDIADLSTYGVGSANNGGGTDGIELQLTGSASAGDFLYIASEQPQFNTFFGFDPDFISSAANNNGDDAVELFNNVVSDGMGGFTGDVIDTFGDINTDGTGQAWDYLDGWAYRNDSTGPDGASFTLAHWTFSGINENDDDTDQASATNPFPIGTYVRTISNDPTLSISSPVDSQVFDPGTTTVDVVFSTQNFDLTGGNFVEYIINGGTPQTTTTSPITIATANGQTYAITLELKDAGGSLTPQVIETINFSVSSVTSVATIAELRAATLDGFYTLTGEAFITFQQSFRNQKFIEDGTGAILIDDSAGVLTNSYAIGDGITGITGQLGDFNGQLQFVPTEDAGAASSTGNTITPQEVTLAQLNATPENYEAELVTVVEVTVDNTIATWNTGTEYVLTQNTDNFNFRTSFFSADYIGQNVPTIPVTITGLITERSGNSYFITARDNNDIVAATSDPVLTITAPAADDVFAAGTATVDVEFTTENFDLIGGNFVEYTINGGSAQTTTTSPITINVTDGTSYTVNLELKDAGGSLSPQVTETISFSIDSPPPSLPLIEQFDYVVGEDLVNQDLWENSSTSTDEIKIASGNLSYAGLDSDVGNSVSFDGAGSDSFIEFAEVNSGKVYASFLMRVTDITTFNTAGYFTALRESSGAFAPRVFLRPSNTTNDIEVGIGNGSSTSVYTTEGYAINTDIFVVYSYDLATGVASLWVNPQAGTSEPSTTLTETDSSPATTIASFLIRQDSDSETPFMIMDELKIGTSWAQVTDATLSIVDFNTQERSFKIYPNPVADGELRFSTAITENIEIKIYNILGKEVLSKKLNGTSLNVSSLNQGVYLAQFIVNGKKVTTEKLIIR
ncbi:T9SS type A sorting domain-containing protein [Aquimarina brevivitae]|uniref:Putative secreted protein (Por secretion system target) n=1 Tax=Aquimarina brevivitae TaxID=323412 RepID=A0A4V2F7F6_9FLAO|nr:T9SS type A sorting domain-containing protein [Aquimarina brevivitae]RZS99649.1 putative secreted protein (Por secretion system target) [Aquimarina brevivitae]